MPLLPYNIHYKIDSSPECSNHSNSFYIKENEHPKPLKTTPSNHLNSQLVNKQNSKKLFSQKLQQNNHNNTSSPSTSSFNSFTVNSPFSSISENKNRLTLPIKQLVNSQTKINSFPLISESPDSAFGDSVDITPTNNNFMNWTELFDYLRKEIVTYIFNFKTSI